MKLQDKTPLTKIDKKHKNFPEYLRVIGDNHIATSYQTPIRHNAFEKDENYKIEAIAQHFQEIMNILGLDTTDDSLNGTPNRVAKMFVNEIFSGLNPKNKPEITLFENKFQYNQMLVEKDIQVNSYCEHHFVPIIGKAHVAYISSGSVIGLSKINRIVDYFARRPQVQERLTEQIAADLKSILNTDDVAVIIEAEHMCVSLRGVKDHGSSTTTTSLHGRFQENNLKNEFLTYVYAQKK